MDILGSYGRVVNPGVEVNHVKKHSGIEVDEIGKFMASYLVVFCHLTLVNIQQRQLVRPSHISLSRLPRLSYLLKVKRKQLHVPIFC